MSELRDVLGGMEKIRRTQEAEMRSMCERDDMLQALTFAQDSFERALIYLCNFDAAVSETGVSEEMTEVYAKIVTDMRDTFQVLTGKKYQPPICRRF